MQMEGFWLPRWRSDTEAHLHFIKNVIYSGKSEFQKIEIVELAGYGKALLLDGIHQFAQFDEFIYQEAIVHPAICLHKEARNVLIIGAGGGNALREVLKHPQIQSVVVIDIDQLVIEKCREFIGSDQGAYEDPRTELIITDGAKYIQETSKKFDCILVDSTTPKPGSIAFGLYGSDFFKNAWSKLNDGGILCGFQSNANILYIDSHRTIRRTLEEVFQQVVSYMVYCPFYAISYLLTISVKNSNLDVEDLKAIQEKIDPIRQKLKFYDEETHIHMFNLPLYVRKMLTKISPLVEQEKLIRY